MNEFFFGDWPNGAGALMVQFVLTVAGAAAGIRLTDDLRKAAGFVRARGGEATARRDRSP